jgi:tetratricopeptide (TPR) repeat protein
MTVLTGVGLFGRLHHAHGPTGFPADPGVDAARRALGGRLELAVDPLRFASSFDDQASPAKPLEPDSAVVRLADAARWMAEARTRHPLDPRVLGLSAHLELAADRLELAERLYREALSLAPRYGEARLGLGVTLARRAATEGDERSARALELQAIAQLTAVSAEDRFFLPALYDRVLLLARVGRMVEARILARRYADLEPESAWSGALLRVVGAGAPG